MRLLWQPSQRSGHVDRHARTAKARSSGSGPRDRAEPAPGVLGEAHRECREARPPQPLRPRRADGRLALGAEGRGGATARIAQLGGGAIHPTGNMTAFAPESLDETRGRLWVSPTACAPAP